MTDKSGYSSSATRTQTSAERATAPLPPPSTTAGLAAAYLGPALELAWSTGVPASIWTTLPTVSVSAAGGLALAALLIAASRVDIARYRLPDPMVAAILGVGLIVAAVGGSMALLHAVVGAVCGFVSLWLVRTVYRSLRGREGLGLGDVKLLGAGGAWVGAEGLAMVVTIAAGSALVTLALIKLARPGFDLGGRIAFGPFLAWGIWLVWLIGRT